VQLKQWAKLIKINGIFNLSQLAPVTQPDINDVFTIIFLYFAAAIKG